MPFQYPLRRGAVARVAAGLGLAALLSASASDAVPQRDDFYTLNDEAMMRMHAGMHVKPSGDVDRDFAAMMIPHHQGAVDMALLELRFGKDERLRRLAQAIIVEQRYEIELMRTILTTPPKTGAGGR